MEGRRMEKTYTLDLAIDLARHLKAAGFQVVFIRSSDRFIALPDRAAAANRGHPKLSYVTLAFLEACCRGEAESEWRVYDVLAVMRQQKETRRQAALARPQKASHHFAPA